MPDHWRRFAVGEFTQRTDGLVPHTLCFVCVCVLCHICVVFVYVERSLCDMLSDHVYVCSEHTGTHTKAPASTRAPTKLFSPHTINSAARTITIATETQQQPYATTCVQLQQGSDATHHIAPPTLSSLTPPPPHCYVFRYTSFGFDTKHTDTAHVFAFAQLHTHKTLALTRSSGLRSVALFSRSPRCSKQHRFHFI